MQPEPSDQEMKRLFRQMLQEDAQQAPAFASLWQAALQKKSSSRQRHRWVKFAFATALIIFVVSSVSILWKNSWFSFKHDAVLMAAWRSPTEALLENSGTLLSDSAWTWQIPDTVVPSQNALSRWSSPTGSLLDFPGEVVWKQTRVFHYLRKQGNISNLNY